MTTPITVEPFFDSLKDMDKEALDLGVDLTHLAMASTDQTVGLSVDKYYVRITTHYLGSKDVEQVQIECEAFDRMIKFYQTMKKVKGNGKFKTNDHS